MWIWADLTLYVNSKTVEQWGVLDGGDGKNLARGATMAKEAAEGSLEIENCI